MVKVIQEDEDLGLDSSNCKEELILKGPKMDPSKTMSIVQEDTVQNIPLMPVNIEITSIEDLKVHKENQTEREGDRE